MLSTASWATLDKVFTCAMLSQKYYDNIEQDFSRAMLSGEHCTRFLHVQCCPKSIKTTLNKIFPVQCCLEALGQHCAMLLPVQCCPRELRQHWTRFFLVQCYLEPQGQHCLGYLHVQCCPKSIKTTLNIIFSCGMLSRTSWATLHKVFTCAMLAHG